MRIIIPLFVAFFAFLFSFVIVFVGVLTLNIQSITAQEYTPLDFLSGARNFQVVVGVDRDKGRYFSYQYEY